MKRIVLLGSRRETSDEDMRRIALAKLRDLVMGDPAATRLGLSLQHILNSGGMSHVIEQSFSDCFRAKASSTLQKRANSLWKLSLTLAELAWCLRMEGAPTARGETRERSPSGRTNPWSPVSSSGSNPDGPERRRRRPTVQTEGQTTQEKDIFTKSEKWLPAIPLPDFSKWTKSRQEEILCFSEYMSRVGIRCFCL